MLRPELTSRNPLFVNQHLLDAECFDVIENVWFATLLDDDYVSREFITNCRRAGLSPDTSQHFLLSFRECVNICVNIH